MHTGTTHLPYRRVQPRTFLNCSNNSGVEVQLIQIHFSSGLTTVTRDVPGTQTRMRWRQLSRPGGARGRAGARP